MAEVATEIKELGDKIVGLTLKQAVDLAAYLKEATASNRPLVAVVAVVVALLR